MRKGSLLVAVGILAAFAAPNLTGQNTGTDAVNGAHVCECGAHPPGPPRDREVKPYAGEPADMRPYAKFAAPYDLNYTRPNIYAGAARDIPEPKDLTEVRIGFFGPIEHNSESVLGLRMLHGAQLALEEANARGGYGGKPFKLMLHNDYNNWQAKAVYGEVRPTEPAIWGSASDEAVKMAYDEKVWAIFGSISSESTHIALRVALRAELPVVSSANSDPTVPETTIPWYFGTMQDDRQQYLTLARRIYTELGLKRVAVLRSSSRYGRFGLGKFLDASRRLGHPVVMEQVFQPGETDYAKQLRVIRSSRPDAVLVVGDEPEAATILKQMRAAGMKQRAFGEFRTLGDTLVAQAGDAAEGFEAVYPYDPTRTDPRWLDFNKRFEARFNEKPEQFASMAYDTINMLLDSICKAGLNRARIHDALADIEEYDGVTGKMVFDPNQKNTAPLYLGTVHNGGITYRLATMEKTPAPQPPVQAPVSAAPPATQTPYARVGENGVDYAGPHPSDVPPGPVRVVLFGPHAAEVAQSPAVVEELAAATAKGREWKLEPVDSDQNWGAASTQLVHALMDGHALAIVATDRDAAHLAEQLALKAFVPVIALSSDKKLTSTNIPWIFRLPSGTTPSAALRLLETAAAMSSAKDQGGLNPERLRNVLASGNMISGFAFLQTGELR
ncbi:MAG: ABC transporter substrate-binding protein [Terracidiphilus sp.]|jgi:ABC-type branched-subunit amino acid transport system substrate-binding protein